MFTSCGTLLDSRSELLKSVRYRLVLLVLLLLERVQFQGQLGQRLGPLLELLESEVYRLLFLAQLLLARVHFRARQLEGALLLVHFQRQLGQHLVSRVKFGIHLELNLRPSCSLRCQDLLPCKLIRLANGNVTSTESCRRSPTDGVLLASCCDLIELFVYRLILLLLLLLGRVQCQLQSGRRLACFPKFGLRVGKLLRLANACLTTPTDSRRRVELAA